MKLRTHFRLGAEKIRNSERLEQVVNATKSVGTSVGEISGFLTWAATRPLKPIKKFVKDAYRKYRQDTE